MGIPCWPAQASLVEVVEAQQARLQVMSTTAASRTPAPHGSNKNAVFFTHGGFRSLPLRYVNVCSEFFNTFCFPYMMVYMPVAFLLMHL